MSFLTRFVKRAIEAIKDVVNREVHHVFVDYEAASEEYANVLRREMIRRAPDGSQNLDEYQGGPYSPSRYGQRPSDRHGWIHLDEGLFVNVSPSGAAANPDGVNIFEQGIPELRFTINIDSTSQHVGFFTTGMPERFDGMVRPHRIPRAPEFMKDRGYPMTFHDKRSGFDVAVWSAVDHPGIPRRKFGDFVVDAYEETKYQIPNILRDYTREIVR